MVRKPLYHPTKKRRTCEESLLDPPLPRNLIQRAKVLQERLQATNEKLTASDHALEDANAHLAATKQALQASEKQTAHCHDELARLHAQATRRHILVHNERRKLRRAKRATDRAKVLIAGLQDHLKIKSAELDDAHCEYANLHSQLADAELGLSEERSQLDIVTKGWENEVLRLRQDLQTCRAKVRALEMRCHRHAEQKMVNSYMSRKAKDQGLTWKIFCKNAYSNQARALARYLVQAGCSQQSAGRVVQKVATLMGYSSSRIMSRRTVGRAITEGGVAARIQLGYELTQTKGQVKS